MKVTVTSKGDFKNTINWLKKASSRDPLPILNAIGSKGVAALQGATPRDTGETAAGWYYKVNKVSGGYEVVYMNNAHPETPVSIPVMIQYGHGTGTGGYVPGIDFINPALKPVFEWGSKELERELK